MAKRAASQNIEDEGPIEIPEIPERSDPYAIGAQRFLSDAMVQLFLQRYKELQLANAILGVDDKTREAGRQAYLALQAMTEDLQRYAAGQITAEERQLLDMRIQQFHTGKTN